jgi:hypothetical protein
VSKEPLVVYSGYSAVAVVDFGYGVKLVALTHGAVDCCAKLMMNWEMGVYLSLWSEGWRPAAAGA